MEKWIILIFGLLLCGVPDAQAFSLFGSRDIDTVRAVGQIGSATEAHLPPGISATPWFLDQDLLAEESGKRIKVCRTETVCKLRYRDGYSQRAVIRNLIEPLTYATADFPVPNSLPTRIEQVLRDLGQRDNLRIRVLAYTDNEPLIGREKRIYGNLDGLSNAAAERLVRTLRTSLALPPESVEGLGRGPARPVASNATARGRALNRRIEIEFWYDDSLQELPDEPQLCPEAAGSENRTRVYHSANGDIEPIYFSNGAPVVAAKSLSQMRQLLAELADKTNPRLRFIGYTSNERLSRRTAAVYGDDIGWSTARARRAMALVSKELGLEAGQAEFAGRGYVQAEDVVNAGFVESDQSRVEVQAVYDEPVILDNYEGVEITRIERDVDIKNPYALNLMRITIDGQPVADPGKSSQDIQRCTDVALDRAQIQFKYDSLTLQPRLNVTAWPRAVRYRDDESTEFSENRVVFKLYSNYQHFFERAEVRIFAETQSSGDTPLVTLPISSSGEAEWFADYPSFQAPGLALKYLLRVYDAAGHFDETRPQPLWVVDQLDPATVLANPDRELLVGYGESRLAMQNISLHGGTIQVLGQSIPVGHRVWLAGTAVPVDEQGRCVAEQILPEGLQTVEVAVLDQHGNGELFLRDLALQESDWFGVGLADLTLSANKTNGPARLLNPDNPEYSEDFSANGRLAFYTTGKFHNGWHLTASADTREGPLDEIFSNFMDKTADAQFRRMDPDQHYPTFGDDSSVVETAPTRGKFYARLEKDKTYGLWGNFKIAYTDNDLAHVDRELYGANLHYQQQQTTSFGEPRLFLDGFAADPGTVSARDDFRGTGGSLFYLQQRDILEGSERLRIEIRDKDSGIVLAAKTLTAELDYDIDYIQGRILLAEILPTTASDNLLVTSESLSGNPVYLVARYEYTPGVGDPDTLVTGGRVHYWFNDHVKLGLTGNWDQEDGMDSNLAGADLVLRRSASTWLKLEGGRTKGPAEDATSSSDGGFTFTNSTLVQDEEISAAAYRVDGSLAMTDLVSSWRGRSSFYLQQIEAGYAGPGQYTENDLTQYGLSGDIPFGERWTGRLKFDLSEEDQGLTTAAVEGNLDYRLNNHWTLSSGVRSDKRTDHSEVVASTQEEGERTDAVVKVAYDSTARWTLYSYVQSTLRVSGDRDRNNRVGVGGSWRLTERFKVLGEISAGDLGTGANLGTEYLYSDRTTLYSNYGLENERSDNGVLSRKGNMTSGFRTRYSDTVSIYFEEQYAHGDVPTGLVHSTGVELAPTDRLNFSANADFGTLKDPDTAADLERKAVGFSAVYGFDKLALASGLEYRVDNSEQSDSSYVERTTWLFKNNFKFQLNPDWRLLGKFNYSKSSSSLGSGYASDYTEAVLGYAYRPVNFDRLNMLFKYTYFYNLPGGSTSSDSDGSFIQRSHIAAVDLMYDLTERWTLGGKYAYRLGQVALDAEDPVYFDSRAQLCVLRADWHFVHRWDALLELRLLDLPDAEDSKSGVLLALYRHLGEHAKLGLGYNFSDFSDDLTQLDYRHQGLFVNLVGKF